MAKNKRAYTGKPVYVVDGSRTPQLKATGAPGPFTAAELAIHAARPLLTRQPFEPDALDEVILGCVMPGPDEANIARVTALRLGCGERVPAWTVQRNCASGMQSIDSAAHDIANGLADIVLAGGTESMSHAPVLLKPAMVEWLARWNQAKGFVPRLKTLQHLRLRHVAPIIGLRRGLTDPVVGLSMGQTAENLAWRFSIDRQAMDEYALASHQRLAKALDAGWLSEIEPLYDVHGHFYDHDTGLRPDTSLEKLAGLKPAFDRPFGQVTAGNSAQVTDGAAWLLLASERAVEQYGLQPRARIVDSQWAGVDPAQMGLGPLHAMTPLLKRHRLDIEKVDYWEINEAFAAQVLACLEAWSRDDYCRRELGLKRAMGAIPRERLNVDGGGISLGHPVGTSGTRIALHLIHVLERHRVRRGVASLCIGGGQGGALLIERVGPTGEENP